VEKGEINPNTGKILEKPEHSQGEEVIEEFFYSYFDFVTANLRRKMMKLFSQHDEQNSSGEKNSTNQNCGEKSNNTLLQILPSQSRCNKASCFLDSEMDKLCSDTDREKFSDFQKRLLFDILRPHNFDLVNIWYTLQINCDKIIGKKPSDSIGTSLPTSSACLIPNDSSEPSTGLVLQTKPIFADDDQHILNGAIIVTVYNWPKCQKNVKK